MKHNWQQIHETHGPLVWQVVYKILQSYSESQDCYQDIMLEAFERSKSSSIQNWPGFLKWLAVRRGIDRLCRLQRSRSRIDRQQDVGLIAKSQSTVAPSLDMRELQARLKAELTSLPDVQAEAFWLRFIEQMSYSEIAEQMNIQTQTVGVLIHRARARMRLAIADLQRTSHGRTR